MLQAHVTIAECIGRCPLDLERDGRIIQAGNGRIGLFNSPAIEREVTTPGVWDLDAAFEEMNTSFREAIDYPNPFRKPKS